MYAKIFASMWDGTLGSRWEAWTTFVYLLANCDRDGFLEIHPVQIAARSGLPLEVVELGLAILEAPDPESRSPEHEGRRIERIDEHRRWGWRILNHKKYRDIKNLEEVRADQRARQARSRANRRRAAEAVTVTAGHAVTRDTVTPCDSSHLSRHTDTDAETEESKDAAEPREDFSGLRLIAQGDALGPPGEVDAREMVRALAASKTLPPRPLKRPAEVDRAWEQTEGLPLPIRKAALQIVQRLMKAGIRDRAVLERFTAHLVENHRKIGNLFAYYQPGGEGFTMLSRALNAAETVAEHEATKAEERRWLEGQR